MPGGAVRRYCADLASSDPPGGVEVQYAKPPIADATAAMIGSSRRSQRDPLRAVGAAAEEEAFEEDGEGEGEEIAGWDFRVFFGALAAMMS